MPIFRVKSVKIYIGQKKIYTSAARGARDKYQVCKSYQHISIMTSEVFLPDISLIFLKMNVCIYTLSMWLSCAVGLEVVYWIYSVWTKHASVGRSANSALQTFTSCSSQRRKNSGGMSKRWQNSDNKKTRKCVRMTKDINDLHKKKLFALHRGTRNWLGWNERRLVENTFST